MKRDSSASIQFGYVTRDLDHAMALWRQRADLGPFYLMENVRVEDVMYRGVPSEFEVTAALAQCGSVQIELLFQHSPEPSALTEGDDGSAIRLHHMGYLLSDADEYIRHLQEFGHDVVTSGVAGGEMPFAYVDTRSALGHMTEVSPNRRAAVEMFEIVRKAAIDWDGKDPVRRL